MANTYLADQNEGDSQYGNNINCTWVINVQDGFYINLELKFFMVRS